MDQHPPSSATTAGSSSHQHLSAEFLGVPVEQLRDRALLGGLLIAAASAAGFGSIGVPSLREQSDGGISAVLLLDAAHIVIHSMPGRQTLLFDVVTPSTHDCRKAVEVLSRRLTTRDIKTVTRGRG